MVSRMKELNLFDDIKYKYVKNLIEDGDDYDVDVEIEDLDCDREAWCKTRFTFNLNIDVSGGSSPIIVDRKFVVEKEYNGSSPYALMMCQLHEDEDEEEEEDEEEDEEEKDEEEEDEEEEDEEEEYTIEVNVVGLGWCRYKDKEDMKKQIVYCKNGYWKIKGDKTAHDEEGNYCSTEEEEEEEEDDEN